jgi:hypothetical protein
MFFRQSALRKDLALTIGGARYAYQRDSHIFSFRDIAFARNAQRSLRSFKEIYDLFYYIIKRERESQRDREIYVPTFFKI